jgi:lipopolysaccharide transport system permease protein
LRQLVQLAVLVVAFSAVLDLGIPNYPVFVFAGLIGWTWFTTALGTSASTLLDNRALVMRANFPTVVLPVVAVTVALVDALFALPVLLAMLALTGELRASCVLLLPLLALQGVMTVGLAWLVSSVAVFLRDVPQIVGLVLLMGFYLTPVYFDVARVPADYQWVVRLNPMAVMLEADRAVLLGTPGPPLASFAGLVAFSGLSLVVGWRVFAGLRKGFVDEL